MAKKEEQQETVPAGLVSLEAALPDSPAMTREGSDGEGWIRTVRNRAVAGGTIVQFETIIRNPDGSYALSQSSVFVPN